MCRLWILEPANGRRHTIERFAKPIPCDSSQQEPTARETQIRVDLGLTGEARVSKYDCPFCNSACRRTPPRQNVSKKLTHTGLLSALTGNFRWLKRGRQRASLFASYDHCIKWFSTRLAITRAFKLGHYPQQDRVIRGLGRSEKLAAHDAVRLVVGSHHPLDRPSSCRWIRVRIVSG